LKNSIRYISKKNLSIEKYDRCIQQAENGLIYAYSWFLDSVADGWGALVLGDYQAVMPIPYLKLKRNLFLKNIYQPDFCQQLGVFSAQLTQEEANQFFESFLTLKPKSYSFNFHDSKCFFKDKFEVKERINYELNLANSYQDITTNYSKNTKRNIQKSIKSKLKFVEKLSVDTFILFKKEQTHYKTNSKQTKKMEKMIKVAIKNGFGEIFGIYQSEKLVATAFFLVDKKRLISLITASSELGKKLGAIAFLNDHLIKVHAGSNKTFDFEGSMLSGVARFYKSFGAVEVNYLTYI